MIEKVIDGIKYRLDEDKLTAEVIALKEDFKLVDGRLVAQNFMKAIFNGYEGDIIVPETVVFEEKTYRVTSIGEKAFARSYSLKSVTIPDSVTSIGNRAFEDCQNLETITIPDYASIGEFAFGRCESLPLVVSIDKEIGGINYRLYFNRTAEVIYKKGYKGDINIPETVIFKDLAYRVMSIGERAFDSCNKLTSITIPDSVTSIREMAFAYCFSLTSIIIPNSVKSIGESAFLQCNSLTKITIPDNIKSIQHHTFDFCAKLKRITIPRSVESIGDLAFSCCSSLSSVVISDGVTSIGDWAFEGCKPLTSIIIPDSVTSIGENAFIGCGSLASIVVAGGNTVYDSRENCNAIIETATNTLIRGCQTSLIPNSVESIGMGAFSGCTSLTSITIPDSVTSIGAEAFRHCDSLESITIPASVRSIERMAFDWCKKLNSITFQGTIVQWEEIELGFCWINGVPTAYVHCTDGDVSVYAR